MFYPFSIDGDIESDYAQVTNTCTSNITCTSDRILQTDYVRNIKFVYIYIFNQHKSGSIWWTEWDVLYYDLLKPGERVTAKR